MVRQPELPGSPSLSTHMQKFLLFCSSKSPFVFNQKLRRWTGDGDPSAVTHEQGTSHLWNELWGPNLKISFYVKQRKLSYVERNKPNELTSKIEAESQIESRFTAVGGCWVGWGRVGRIEQKRNKREKRMDMGTRVVIAGGESGGGGGGECGG